MYAAYFYHSAPAYLCGVYIIQPWEVPIYLMPRNKRWPGRHATPAFTLGYPL